MNSKELFTSNSLLWHLNEIDYNNKEKLQDLSKNKLEELWTTKKEKSIECQVEFLYNKQLLSANCRTSSLGKSQFSVKKFRRDDLDYINNILN